MQPTVIIIHPIYIYDIQELYNKVKCFLFVFKDIHTFIQQGNITLIKNDRKLLLQNISVSNQF